MGGTKRGREEKNTKMVRRKPSDPNKHKPVRRANFRASACAVPALSLLLSVGTSMCFTGALVAQGPHGEGRGLDRMQREGRGAPTHPQYGQSGPKIAMQLRPSPDPEDTPAGKVPKVASTSSVTYVKNKPSLPKPLGSVLKLPTDAFDKMAEVYQSKQMRRDAVSRVLQAVVRDSTAAVHHLHRGDMAEADVAIRQGSSSLQQAIEDIGEEEDGGRYGPLAGAMERLIQAKSFAHFLSTGALLPKSEVAFATYDEYIPGVIGFANELQRYAVKQGRERDIGSLLACKMLVEALQAELMLFDFRNGPMRHKFDSVKYVVRKLEDTIFELSLQEGVEISNVTQEGQEGAGVAAVVVLDVAEFEQMRAAMEDNDEKREMVIKKCRDLQKASKNSIYDLHRGNLQKAEEQLACVKSMALELLPTIEENKMLRGGAYSGVLEEYAEGMLFLQFLKDGSVQSMSELAPVNANEYIGGLLDFTGEVGRYAVAAATRREVQKVLECQDVVDQILGKLLLLPGLPGNMHKKTDVAKTTLRKIDNILYELSLARKSRASEDDAPGGGGGGGAGAAEGGGAGR